MNDNAKPGLLQRVLDWLRSKRNYLQGWLENRWFYKRLQARQYDAPARSWWWYATRGLAVIAILAITHAMAVRYGKAHGIVKVVGAPTPITADLIPKAALNAWKDRAQACELTAADLTAANAKLESESAKLRSALSGLPDKPPKLVPAARPPVAKPRPRPRCQSWFCKFNKLVTDPASAVSN